MSFSIVHVSELKFIILVSGCFGLVYFSIGKSIGHQTSSIAPDIQIYNFFLAIHADQLEWIFIACCCDSFGRGIEGGIDLVTMAHLDDRLTTKST